jgi:hypothetical protein
MDKNDATAELILSNIELPEFECESPPLSLNHLQALGLKVLNPEPGLSMVTVGNRTFSGGYFEMLLRTGDRIGKAALAKIEPMRIRCSGKPHVW